MGRHRLFVALRPPAAARAALLDWMGGIVGARWQDDDQLHCTVRFVGEVDGRTADDVAMALDGVRSGVIEATSGAVGTFADGGRIGNLWLEIRPFLALSSLHAKVDRRLVAAGIAPDRRAYRPHVTLARFPRRMAPQPGLEYRIAPPPPLAMRFETFGLFESRLTADGAVYEEVATYPLDRPGAL